MIGRVVVTSVPRGLDGGTGFQTVLRTHGLSPAIAERLTIRASYSHPYGLGDARNPHVIFHRIETLAGKTIHVLGSVRDVGTSYTGRSNHLAELIAVDAAETGSLAGGPAFAARSFPWLSRWTGDPREVPRSEESAIPARDSLDPEFTGRPSRCVAWERATGDAGWAGELAQSFLDGRRALLWAGHDVDILELFAEAARLLPASVRWQLTFNTCEIEPFPAHWRAVRPELGLVGKYEPKNELRLVIAKIRENRSRPEHDHALVRQARGEFIAADRDAAATRATGPAADATSADARLRAELERIRAARVGRPHGDVAGAAHDGHSRSSWSIVASVFAALAVGALLLSAMAAAWVASNDPGFFNRVLSDGRIQIGSINRHDELKPKQQETKPTKPDSGEQAVPETPVKKEALGTRAGEASESSQKEIKPNDDEGKRRNEAKQLKKIVAAITFNKTLAEFRNKLVPLLETAPYEIYEAKPVVLLDFNDFNPKIFEHVTLVELLNELEFEIDIAGPHKDPLSIRRLDGPGIASGERSWEVLGRRMPNGLSVGDNEPEPVCTIGICADKRQLVLYPKWEKQRDELATQLENSLVLISTRDPASGSAPIVRQQVQLSKPLLASEIKTLSLVGLECQTKQFDSNLADRTSGFDDRLCWSIVVEHPSWIEPKKITTRNPKCEFEFPADGSGGIEVKYLDYFKASGQKRLSVQERKAVLSICGEITFLPSSFSVQVANEAGTNERGMVRGLDDVPDISLQDFRGLCRGEKPSALLGAKFANKLIAQAEYRGGMWVEYLESQNIKPQDFEASKKRLASLEEKHRRFSSMINATGPFRTMPSGAGQIQITHEEHAKRLDDITAESGPLSQWISNVNSQVAHWHRKATSVPEDAFAKAVDGKWAEPFAVRLRELCAVVKDKNDEEYKIFFVKPDDK